MQRALGWVRRHRGLVAAVVAVWVVLKGARWIAGGAWAAREWIPWDDVWPWLRSHWLAGALVVLAAGAVVFAGVRAAIGVLDRRERAKARPREGDRPQGDGPADPALVSGDPLAARDR